MEEEKVTVTETAGTGEDQTIQAPSQKRTPEEIAEYNLKKKAEEAKALGIDPAKTLGIDQPTVPSLQMEDDDQPLTVGQFRQLQRMDARKTAEAMARELPDEIERAAVLNELKFIVPSGDAEADFRRAQASANVERNAKIAEMAGKREAPRRTATGGSANAPVEEEFTPTAEEQQFMRPPYNLTKEQVLAQRKQAEQQ